FAPSSMHLSLIDLATHLARIAIERARADREREGLVDAKRFADRYRMVLQATGDAVWDWDVESNAVLWNGGLACFGYEVGSEEHTLAWWLARVHHDDVERIRNIYEGAIASSETMCKGEFRFRRVDGSFAEVVSRGIIIRDDMGKAVRMVGAMQ